MRLQGQLSNARADAIAKEHLGVTGRQLREKSKQARETWSLSRKEGSGRPLTVSSPKVLEFIKLQAESWQYEFTAEGMAIAVRHRFGCGSRPSLQRLMQDLGRSEERRLGKECVGTCRSRG